MSALALRRACALVSALVLLVLGAGLLLPAQVELRYARTLGTTRAELTRYLVEPARWPAWAPSWMGADAIVTAALPERGVWWDIPGLGAGGAKAAALYEAVPGSARLEDTRVTWLVRYRTGRDPLSRWGAYLGRARREAEVRAALERLGRLVERPRADSPGGSLPN